MPVHHAAQQQAVLVAAHARVALLVGVVGVHPPVGAFFDQAFDNHFTGKVDDEKRLRRGGVVVGLV